MVSTAISKQDRELLDRVYAALETHTNGFSQRGYVDVTFPGAQRVSVPYPLVSVYNGWRGFSFIDIEYLKERIREKHPLPCTLWLEPTELGVAYFPD